MRASVNSICEKRFKELLESEKVAPENKKGKCNNIHSRACLYIIGIGPGGRDYFSIRAVEAIKKCDVVVSYKNYIKYIDDFINNKTAVITTGMKKEIERGIIAIEKALEGLNVAVISTGDAGIYGMAGLIIELLEKRNLIGKINFEIIPGISAINAASSILGAPIMHDFAVISLSDLLTPWELIERRLKKAAEGDFVIALYNPKSKNRPENLKKAIEILKKYKKSSTPCGIVKNALREGQSYSITTLENFDDTEIDMNTIVIIGNSQSRIIDYRYILTPRGYSIDASCG